MPKLKFTKPRATLEETLEFANHVREAGGGNPLDALMPAVPEDSTQCLVAKNLNFNCSVTTVEFRGQRTAWVMVLEDKEIRDNIADSLHLAKINYDEETSPYDGGGFYDGGEFFYAVVLPREIGEVAEGFDSTMEILREYDDVDESRLNEMQKELLQTFNPYIEESIRETYALGEIKDGKLVL